MSKLATKSRKRDRQADQAKAPLFAKSVLGQKGRFSTFSGQPFST